VEQHERDPHACIDGLTGHETTHPQVPMFYYTCDEKIADLISIMNYCGIHTVNSCQDNSYTRGTVPRVWVEIIGECLPAFLAMLDQPDEAAAAESLSRRMETSRYPDQDYEDNRAWHYKFVVQRVDGELVRPTMSIRFPATDLPDVVARLRAAAMKLDGRAGTRQSREMGL
jgi:hypothetical protein